MGLSKLYFFLCFSTLFLFSCQQESLKDRNSKKTAIQKLVKKKQKSDEISNKTKIQTNRNEKQEKRWFQEAKGKPFVYKPAKDGQNAIFYKKYEKDKILEEIKSKREKTQKKHNKEIEQFVKEQKEKRKLKKETRKILKSDISTLHYPKKLKQFHQNPHLPPVPQYYTGTCWSFASTSFFESEIQRLSQKQIKLSEMWPVYWEYVEKARRFIKMKGFSYVSQGDEPNALLNVYKQYGAVPYQAYKGVTTPGEKYDHTPMVNELKTFLNFIKANNLWDEKANLIMVKAILNKYMGEPPRKFVWKEKEYTPEQFLKQVTGLKMDDYVATMSTLSHPYFTRGLLDVPDNWWRSEDYLNLPLELWTKLLRDGVEKGYGFVIGGDVSEPGKIPEKDIIFVPSFDLPVGLINKHSREFRISNKTTTDDHGVHLTGHYFDKSNNKYWYLIKDSGRSSRYGNFKGYYFMSEDYLKLKILNWMAHKDVISSIANRIGK
jgi:bleomycin hydrolase